VRVAFDPRIITVSELRVAIRRSGFRARPAPWAAAGNTALATKQLICGPAGSAIDRALSSARANGLPIIVQFSAAWCGPCKRLDAVTLADPEVEKLLSGTTLVRVDMDADPEAARSNRVTAAPTLLFVSSDGSIVDRLVGFEGPAEFAGRLRRVAARATLQEGPPRE
jgi:thiol:disulfide interchange protein